MPGVATLEFPQQVNDGKWIDIAAGGFHSLVLKADGTIWAWGLNGNGQLGTGNTTSQDTAVQVGTDDDWISVAAGQAFSYGIKSDSSLWAWGWNDYGTLGLGNLDPALSPVQVSPGSKWISIGAGGYHTLAIRSDSTLWSWGQNPDGQLGDGSVVNSSSPVQVSTAHWSRVSAGFEFSLAVDASGNLYSWGFNGNGQLGNGSSGAPNVPTQIMTSTTVSEIAAGSTFAFAIAADGSLWGWGYNGNGQLGDGTTTQHSSPEQIGADFNWEHIWAAQGTINGSTVYGMFMQGLKDGGTTRCWAGLNNAGQLGSSDYNTVHDMTCEDVPLGLAKEVSANGLIFPNPTAGKFTLRTESTGELEILDQHGNLLKRQAISAEETEIDVEKFAPGIYFVKLGNSVTKLVKQ